MFFWKADWRADKSKFDTLGFSSWVYFVKNDLDLDETDFLKENIGLDKQLLLSTFFRTSNFWVSL